MIITHHLIRKPLRTFRGDDFTHHLIRKPLRTIRGDDYYASPDPKTAAHFSG
jgi:hypothetical protein